MKAKSNYRQDIQVLRGISIIAVLLFHFDEELFPNGYLGVDVFFVISGFVITPLVLQVINLDYLSTNYQKSRFNRLKYFYKKRFYRLAPALAVTLVFSCLLIFFLGPIYDHKRFSIQGFATLLLSGNLSAIRYSQDYFSPYPNPLIHTWSLSVEEQIYLIIPIIFLSATIIKQRSHFILISILSIITIISLVIFLFPANLNHFSSLSFSNTDSISFYSPISRIWQFCIGCITYLMYQKIKTDKIQSNSIYDLVFIVLVILVIFVPNNITSQLGSLAVTILAALIIYFKCLETNIPYLSKVLIWFGDRSYSIYLVHMPVLYLAKYSPYIKTDAYSNYSWQILFALLITLALSSASYSLIENRYRLNNENNFSFKIRHSLYKFWIMPLSLFMILMVVSNNYRFSGLPPANKVLSYNWDKNCQVLSGTNSFSTTPCLYEKYKSTKNILLIGDSHAAAQSRAIVSAGNSQNFNVSVFTYSGCPFLVNNKQFKLSSTKIDKNCEKHNILIKKFINEKRPDLVIYSQRSTSLYAPNFGSKMHQVKFLDQILNNIKALQSSKTKVLIIGPNPEIVLPSTFKDYILENKSQWSSVPFDDNKWLTNELSLSSINYLDTLSMFCISEMTCKADLVVGAGKKVWLFEDLNHLSIEGSLKLVPPLIKIIDSIF